MGRGRSNERLLDRRRIYRKCENMVAFPCEKHRGSLKTQPLAILRLPLMLSTGLVYDPAISEPIDKLAAIGKKIILLKPRGFCAGVVRAIDVVKIALDLYGGPIYVRKEIVHNRHVVDELREAGAIFVEELSEVPEGARVIFSAHGVSPAVRAEAKQRNCRSSTPLAL